MALFHNRQESNLRSCVHMIEEVIAALGHPLAESRLENQDATPAWRLSKGSAHIYVVLYRKEDRADGQNRLQVTAPVMHIDDAKIDRPRLFQTLLELNAGGIEGAAFALKGTDVVLIAERPTLDLDRSEVEDLVTRVAEYADFYDDKLVAEFGGRPAGLSAAPVKPR